MIRPAPEDLDGDHGLFELVVSAFQLLLDYEPQKSGHTVVV
jgi:hypothetical protein